MAIKNHQGRVSQQWNLNRSMMKDQKAVKKSNDIDIVYGDIFGKDVIGKWALEQRLQCNCTKYSYHITANMILKELKCRINVKVVIERPF